jgi:hypothetical protein
MAACSVFRQTLRVRGLPPERRWDTKERGPMLSTTLRLRAWSRGLVGVTVVGLGVVVSPTPPAAAESYVGLKASSWAYTDSRSPDQIVVDAAGDVPVGSWRDAEGKHHKSRAYFTFDLSRFHGTRIIRSEGFFAERQVNNCDADAAYEMWLTDPVSSANNWREPPTALTMLDAIGRHPYGWCPAPRREYSVGEAVRDAVRAGQETITIEFRIPEEWEGDVNRGRWVERRPSLFMHYNVPPGTPTELITDRFHPCATQSPGSYIPTSQPELSARFADPEPADNLTATFAVWPVDQPENRTEIPALYARNGDRSSVTVPSGVLVHGGTYGWAVRASDRYDVSEWSGTCYFTVDLVRPAPPTSVSSEQYPPGPWSGGPGITGLFRVTADSRDSDVTRFAYRIRNGFLQYADANESGVGQIEFTPLDPGAYWMTVYSVDRAGNHSTSGVRYEFGVLENRPDVEVVYSDPEVPIEVTFRPRRDNVVSYTYRVDDSPEVTVPAGPDGTASVSLTVDGFGYHDFYVRSSHSDGYVTRNLDYGIYIVDNRPGIIMNTFPDAGVPVMVDLYPNRDNVVSYTYRIDDGPETTVPADPSGWTTVYVTFDQPGVHTFYARSSHSDGYTTRYQEQEVYVS